MVSDRQSILVNIPFNNFSIQYYCDSHHSINDSGKGNSNVYIKRSIKQVIKMYTLTLRRQGRL